MTLTVRRSSRGRRRREMVKIRKRYSLTRKREARAWWQLLSNCMVVGVFSSMGSLSLWWRVGLGTPSHPSTPGRGRT